MVQEPQQGQLGGIALIGAGFALVFMTLGGYIAGVLIDRAVHSSPWGAVIGLFLGFAVGIWDLYRIASRVMISQPLPPPADEEKIDENSSEAAGNRDNNHETEEE